MRDVGSATRTRLTCVDCGKFLKNDFIERILGGSVKYVDGFRCKSCSQNKDGLLRELAIYNIGRIKQGKPIMRQTEVKKVDEENETQMGDQDEVEVLDENNNQTLGGE